MEVKVYKGLIREDNYGENYEAVFIGDMEEPIAETFEEDFAGKQVSVRYWTSKVEKTKEELIEGLLRNLMGMVDAEYGDRYSDITGYLWTDEEINIGGHNLLEEIRSYVGQYIYLEVEIHSLNK